MVSHCRFYYERTSKGYTCYDCRRFRFLDDFPQTLWFFFTWIQFSFHWFHYSMGYPRLWFLSSHGSFRWPRCCCQPNWTSRKNDSNQHWRVSIHKIIIKYIYIMIYYMSNNLYNKKDIEFLKKLPNWNYSCQDLS